MAPPRWRLTDREVAILRVLAEDGEEQTRGMFAGRIGVLAGFERRQRIDAGTTRTLDALSKRRLVRFSYPSSALLGPSTSRKWWISAKGRKALGEYAFGDE
jgi:hypothetical protein